MIFDGKDNIMRWFLGKRCAEDVSMGAFGEDAAARFLKKNRYEILHRNWYNSKGKRLGEIDIIARSADGTIVFVEVKTREVGSDDRDILPEEQITPQKLYKIQRVAECYIAAHDLWQSVWRYDAVAVYLKDGHVQGIKHMEHIFF